MGVFLGGSIDFLDPSHLEPVLQQGLPIGDVRSSESRQNDRGGRELIRPVDSSIFSQKVRWVFRRRAKSGVWE